MCAVDHEGSYTGRFGNGKGFLSQHAPSCAVWLGRAERRQWAVLLSVMGGWWLEPWINGPSWRGMGQKRALVIGSSGAIGGALVQGLKTQGYVTTGLSRSGDGLDVTDPSAVERILKSQDGPYDRIIVASGGLEIAGVGPEKTIRAIDANAMASQFALNAIGPALVLKHAHRLLPRNAPSVVAVLSARVGSIGDNRLGGWISYRAAKAAVNQIVHTSAIELARTHKQVCCVALHPGTVQSNLTQKYAARHATVTPPEAAANLMRVIDGLTPADTGLFFDWAGKRVDW